MQQRSRLDTCAGPKSDLQCAHSLQEVMFFVVRISVGFMPHSVGYGIIQVCSLLPLASYSLHAVHLRLGTAKGANIGRRARKHPNFTRVYPTCPSLNGRDIKLKDGAEKGRCAG